ncbi:vWA domain-containing protein [Hahella ganghwensis]|uniref:vWA domain-containing protein n=1 Tax=Hahella ganghwensis TaxID=286420 RepID=UPI00037ECCD1|nr:vWA domain-containing protein [Hahella ganghwensis]
MIHSTQNTDEKLPISSALGFRKTLLAAALIASLGCSGQVLADATGRQAPQAEQAQLIAPKIQVAILLDTSSSMDGLIDQTRNQLWEMVDEFSKAKQNGVSPILEVAVYEYGNDRLSSENGYLRQVTGLTRELDRVSEALFSLTTMGGSEFCGYAIDAAVKGLQWSQSPSDIRAIFIAGNEPFTQGPVSYSKAINLAKKRDITVSTIFAGNYNEGTETGWRKGAQLAGGNYMNIDQDYEIAHIVAPQDQKIAELNNQLNQTYIPYGSEGEAAASRQYEQDQKSNDVSLGLLVKRVKSKVSSVYDNAKWDLVDAVESGEVALEELDQEALPAPMADMNPEEQKGYIEAKREERQKIQSEIKALTEARQAFVAEEKRKQAKPEANTVNDAMMSAIRVQGEKKAFVFE